MNARACAAAVAILAAIVCAGLVPSCHVVPADDGCVDASRVSTLDPDRGRTRVLSCPLPCDGSSCPAPPTGAAALVMGVPIDVNRADADELRSLPGIGPGLARRIVDDREARGIFRSLAELRRVRGIGAGKLRALDGWAVADQADARPFTRAIDTDGSTR